LIQDLGPLVDARHHLQRPPEIGIPAHLKSKELRRRYADNRERHVVESDVLPHRRRIEAEPALTKSVADDRDRIRLARLIVIFVTSIY